LVSCVIRHDFPPLLLQKRNFSNLQSPSFNPNLAKTVDIESFDSSSFDLIGNASFNSGSLQLTSAGLDLCGQGFYNKEFHVDPDALGDFSSKFVFHIDQAWYPADGMAFVVSFPFPSNRMKHKRTNKRTNERAKKQTNNKLIRFLEKDRSIATQEETRATGQVYRPWP